MWNPPKSRSLAAVLLLAPLTLSEGLSFHVEDETVLQKEFTIDVLFELDDVSVTLNGQDMSDGVDLGDAEMEASVRALISDEYRRVEDGRPIELVRSFEEVSMEYDSGDEQGTESAEDLEGISVVFQWNEDEGDYDVSFAENSDGDEEILGGLFEDMDFRALLPDGEVEEGDAWEVPGRGALSVLFPGMRLEDLANLADGDDDIPEEILEQLSAIPEGMEMSCEYAGVREEDGVALGVIQVTLEGSSVIDLGTVIEDQLPDEVDADIDAASFELNVEGEGELLWHLEAGHMVSYSMEAELEAEVVASASIDAQGQTFDVEGNILFVGELTWSAGLSDE